MNPATTDCVSRGRRKAGFFHQFECHLVHSVWDLKPVRMAAGKSKRCLQVIVSGADQIVFRFHRAQPTPTSGPVMSSKASRRAHTVGSGSQVLSNIGEREKEPETPGMS